MKYTNSQLSQMVKQLRADNRVGHPALDGLRWASSSIRLMRDGTVCQGHVAYGPHPGRSRDRSPLWLGIITQGPKEKSGQRYWLAYAGASPVLASAEVSQKLYTRTLDGFTPTEECLSKFNLLPSTQVEEDLLEQIKPQVADSALEQALSL